MPVTPCSIIITPHVPVTVDITTAGGVRATAYTTENGSSTHSFPLAITTPTRFYFATPGEYITSALYNGNEVANQEGGTKSVGLLPSSVASFAVGVNQPGEAGRIQALLAHGSAFTQTYSTTARTVPNATYAAPAVTAASVVTTAAGLTAYGYTQAQADALIVSHNAALVDLTATRTAQAALAADVLELKKLIGALIDDGQAGVLPG